MKVAGTPPAFQKLPWVCVQGGKHGGEIALVSVGV